MGIKFEKIEAGMTLYDVHSERAGNTTAMRQGLWKVYVKDVNADERRVFASWNGNKPSWYHERAICKFRAARPEWMKGDIWDGYGFRCPTCSVKSREKDSSLHKPTCDHPKAKTWRKKNPVQP